MDEIRHTPPYVSYKSFNKLINMLERNLFTRIDLSYMSDDFSVRTGTNLMLAMRFLNFIDGGNRPTTVLKLLTAGTTKERRATLLRQVADEAYAFVFKANIDIQTATYAELEAVFQSTYRMDYDICHKCIRFFIEFCKDAGILLSPEIVKKQKILGTIPEMKNGTYKWTDENQCKSDNGTNPIDNRLQQVIFLYSLRNDFDHFDSLYNQAAITLPMFDDQIPKELTEEEWFKVVDALRLDFEYVGFLYKIALWTESGILSADVLYSLYYQEIADGLTFKLNTLIQWCGTGCDLVLGYNSHNVARIAVTLINLLEKLNVIHQEHGADLVLKRDSVLIANFKSRTKSFISDPSKFDEYSPNYIDRKITIREKEAVNGD